MRDNPQWSLWGKRLFLVLNVLVYLSGCNVLLVNFTHHIVYKVIRYVNRILCSRFLIHCSVSKKFSRPINFLFHCFFNIIFACFIIYVCYAEFLQTSCKCENSNYSQRNLVSSRLYFYLLQFWQVYNFKLFSNCWLYFQSWLCAIDLIVQSFPIY